MSKLSIITDDTKRDIARAEDDLEGELTRLIDRAQRMLTEVRRGGSVEPGFVMTSAIQVLTVAALLNEERRALLGLQFAAGE